MPKLPQSLPIAILKNLKKHINRVFVVDRSGLKRHAYRGRDLLVAGYLLAKRLRELPDERIGVVLPPCGGNYIANIAVMLSGKQVVNLNFVAATDSMRATLAKADLKTVITSATLQQKFPQFPWESVSAILLEEFFKQKPSMPTVMRALGAFYLLPSSLLARHWGLDKANLDDTVSLLFSSGSTGQPKGVPLTHRNLLTNLWQVEQIKLLPAETKILANLPLFHSFGQTCTLWYPLTHPIEVYTYPTPLEAAATAQIVEEEKINILLGTASFFRLYMRGISAEKFASLRCVVAGAEKTPAGLHAAWEEKFGSRYYEGYGLTETSPVVGVNLEEGYRLGTIGRLVPALEARVVDPSTGEIYTDYNRRGVIELKGDSIFDGYLDDPDLNAEVFSDGWFNTGDLGSLSEDGYLTVDGRLRRFSKLAGEMVPHGAIEEAIAKIYNFTDHQPIVVTGRRDDQKGESLVVLSEVDLDMEQLRSALQQAGLPNLWVPRLLKRIEAIPMLPTGKLDLAKIAQIANAD